PSHAPHRASHPFPTRRSSDLFYGSKTYWAWEPRDWSQLNLLRGRGLTLGGEGTQRLILVKNDGKRYVNESAEYNPDVPECEFTTDRKSTRLNSSHVKISYAVF